MPSGAVRDWPLHLARSAVAGPYEAPTSGLPATLAELADQVGAMPALRDAQVAIDEAIAAFPDRRAILEAVLLNTATPVRSFAVAIADRVPAEAACAMEVPDGWRVENSTVGFEVSAPADLAPGLYSLPLSLDGAPATTVRRLATSHTGPRARVFPARILVRAVAVQLPDARIGYVAGGNDRVSQLAAGHGAGRGRPFQAVARRGGAVGPGHHRGGNFCDARPSRRWRVTDAAAAVTVLIPDHPLLTTPNVIGAADWAGWSKERGLYFAKDWDAAYTSLLVMADQGEAPQRGALLSAEIGAGRHTHTSLILHHQMEKLVPGAFRLMANLVA